MLLTSLYRGKTEAQIESMPCLKIEWKTTVELKLDCDNLKVIHKF